LFLPTGCCTVVFRNQVQKEDREVMHQKPKEQPVAYYGAPFVILPPVTET
jgi:hypothetical protein